MLSFKSFLYCSGVVLQMLFVLPANISTSEEEFILEISSAEGEFKKRSYNHNSSFKNQLKMNDTTLAKHIWDLKLKHNVTPTLKWYILKSVAPYSNITKKCRLCLQEKFEILSYPNPDELLNKRSELVSKCRHMNKFLLANYKAND